MADRNAKITHLEAEVSEVTHLLRDDVEKVMDRGERLDNLQDRTEDLQSNSLRFKKAAVRVKRRMCCENAKATCVIILVVSVIIAAIVLAILFTIKPWEHSGGGGNNTVHAQVTMTTPHLYFTTRPTANVTTND